ncbi:hypothetical protein D3C71_1507640 [compost metagenome]
MQIRCTHIECVQQHFVQEFDDGSIFYISSPSIVVVWCLFDGCVVKFKITTTTRQRFQRFTGRFGGGFYQAAELVVLRNNPVHPHLGGEFYFFGCFLVRRVCSRNNQAIIALAEHNNPICLAYLAVEQFFRKP